MSNNQISVSREIIQSKNLCSVECQTNGVTTDASALKSEKGREFKGFILIEVPELTVAKISKSDGKFGQIARLIESHDKDIWYRLQLILSDPDYTSPDHMKIILYKYVNINLDLTKLEYNLPDNEIIDFVKDYLNSQDLSRYSPYLNEDTRQDVLVCTHALRDVCCGKFGYPIYKFLKENHDSTTHRIWRVNHITGHRAAPTMLILPDGRYWGYLTTESSQNIISNTISVEEISRHYRGLVNLSSPEQIAEKHHFAKYPSAWPNKAVKIRTSSNGGDKYEVVIFNGEQIFRYDIRKEGKIKVGQTKCGKMKPITNFTILS